MRLSNRLLASAAVAAATLLAGAAAQASTLTGTLTADNEFNAYLSTSDNTLGTLISSGNNWMSPQSLSTTLDAGVTYYLHVVANNFGGPGDGGGNPDSFLGSFSLSDATHAFANGLQTLGTGVADWRASANGAEQSLSGPISWTAPTGAPIDLGQNGGAIWGNAVGGPMAGISTSSHWIWSATDPSGEALFSTTISAVGGGVPEPSEWALMIVGFGLAGAALRRRRAVAAAA